ncbi:hypothetical protein CDAR_611841 [Caerostris darwini]|uniref:Uncharacterized protein n=1 Tax=Caerostris darwini TaxID=1538125 RepID=A0AAV4MSU5_9ARAC|nr:hypothetical protein CDAR_611841 [Caerostris darwini]
MTKRENLSHTMDLEFRRSFLSFSRFQPLIHNAESETHNLQALLQVWVSGLVVLISVRFHTRATQITSAPSSESTPFHYQKNAWMVLPTMNVNEREMPSPCLMRSVSLGVFAFAYINRPIMYSVVV